MIYEAPAEADWPKREDVWRVANPALGDFRSLEEMRIVCQRAQEIPAQENSFRRLYLNQWTEQAARWLSLAQWDACRARAQRRRMRGGRVTSGSTSARRPTLTALVGVYPDADGPGFDVRVAAFLPADTAARARRRGTGVPYDEWARRGV